MRWHAGGGPSNESTDDEPWVRVDVHVASGPWHGEFVLAGPATPLASKLWAVTQSTVLAFAISEDWTPSSDRNDPVLPWNLFQNRLNRIFSIPVNPSSAIAHLITDMDWPHDPLGIHPSKTTLIQPDSP